MRDRWRGHAALDRRRQTRRGERPRRVAEIVQAASLGYSPAELLSDEEIEAIRGQPTPHMETANVEFLIQEWSQGTNVSEQEWDLMNHLASEPKFVQAKASMTAKLDALRREARRRISLHNKRSVDVKMDETLQREF